MFLAFHQIQLDVSINSFATIRSGNSIENCPLLLWIYLIAYNLWTHQIIGSIHDFDFIFIGIVNIEMVNSGCSNQSQYWWVDPLPINNIVDFDVFHFGLIGHVVDLDNTHIRIIWFLGWQSQNVLFGMTQCHVCSDGLSIDLLSLEINGC